MKYEVELSFEKTTSFRKKYVFEAGKYASRTRLKSLVADECDRLEDLGLAEFDRLALENTAVVTYMSVFSVDEEIKKLG